MNTAHPQIEGEPLFFVIPRRLDEASREPSLGRLATGRDAHTRGHKHSIDEVNDSVGRYDVRGRDGRGAHTLRIGDANAASYDAHVQVFTKKGQDGIARGSGRDDGRFAHDS